MKDRQDRPTERKEERDIAMETQTRPVEVDDVELETNGSTPEVKVTRHRVDALLVAGGVVVTLVLLVAGALLMWGNSFSEDYVSDELAAQNITFPDEEALVAQGRDDLAQYGGELVDTGQEAEAYASYIQGHVDGIADGATYSDLGGPERAAEAAVVEATEAGAPADDIAALEEEAATISAQRDSVYKGQMLRGALLNTYAWSVIGRIAGIAAVFAFVGAAVMAVLTVLGFVHMRKTPA